MACGKRLFAALLLTLAALPAFASYTFDGTNDQLKGLLATQRADPLTLACWVKSTPDGTQDVALQIGVGSSGNDTYSIRTSSAAQQYRATSIDNAAAASQAQISGNYDGVWVALVGTWASDSDRTAWLDEPTVAQVNNTATRTVANTLDDVSIGEGLDDASDWNGLIAECAIWVGVLEEAEVDAYSNGTPAPLVADTEELIAYYPMATDTGGTVANEGSDTGGDLTASGNAAFNADHPPINTTPSFDAGLVETADTINSATFSYDASANAVTLWTGLYRRGAANPTCAQVEAGTNAHGTASEATTGSADSITITTDDADPQAAYDAEGCLENASGYSALNELEKVVLEPPANETYFETDAPPGGSEISLFDGEATANDDYAHATLVVYCFEHGIAAHPVSYLANGTLTVDTPPGHAVTLLTLEWRYQDVSAGTWSNATKVLFGINNIAPSWVGLNAGLFPNGWLLPINESNEFPLDDLWQHSYARPLTHNINNLPAGFSENGEILTVLPTVCGTFTTPQFQAFDDLGLSTNETETIRVGDYVANVVNSTEAAAITALEASGCMNAVAGGSQYSGTIALGNVISTDPVAGTLMEPAGDVSYVLSLGAAPPSLGRAFGFDFSFAIR